MAEEKSTIDDIPAAPGIELKDLIDFKKDCIDPVALLVVVESLDYALETSARRLKSLGKIFKDAEASAYADGKGILPTIKAIRNAFLTAPRCSGGNFPIMKSKPPIEPKAEALTSVTMAKLAKAKSPEEVLELVKGHPILEKAAKDALAAKAKAAPKETKKKEREIPELWGKAAFEGVEGEALLSGTYDSPGALAKALQIRTRGAKDMVVAFRRAGFEVKGNGDVVKGKTKFVVKRVKETPARFRAETESIYVAPESREMKGI